LFPEPEQKKSIFSSSKLRLEILVKQNPCRHAKAKGSGFEEKKLFGTSIKTKIEALTHEFCKTNWNRRLSPQNRLHPLHYTSSYYVRPCRAFCPGCLPHHQHQC